MPRALSDDENARVRAAAAELVAARDGIASRLAEEIGVKQATISRFLNEKTGTTYAVAGRVAALLGVDREAMLRGERRAVATVRDLPEYQAARDALVDRYVLAVLDAATRALDAVGATAIDAARLDAACRFALDNRPLVLTEPKGATKKLIDKIAEECAPERKQRRGG